MRVSRLAARIRSAKSGARSKPVRPDHHARVLGNDVAALAATANADNAPAIGEDFLDGESLANLRPRRGCGVDKQLVEDGPAWCVGDR